MALKLLCHIGRWTFFYLFGHLRDFIRAQVQKLRSSKVPQTAAGASDCRFLLLIRDLVATDIR